MKHVEYTYPYPSPLGGITLASDGESLTGLWFDGQKYFADNLDACREEKPLPVFDQAARWLDLYFAGQEPGFTPPLKMKTTPFRKAVWEILLTIPYGRTMTYGQIAQQIARQKNLPRMSRPRQLGAPVGHNAIFLIITLPRGGGGGQTAVSRAMRRWTRKIKLLTLEGADLTGLFVPENRNGTLTRAFFDSVFGKKREFPGRGTLFLRRGIFQPLHKAVQSR
jgi:methylated-DNA-[protein]-cysteine S-methyltransferase